MKLLITSVDAIIDKKTNDYFDGVKEALEAFEALDKDNGVWIISINDERLNSIPNDFEKLPIKDFALRKSPKLIEIISKHTGVDYQDILVLGAKEDDFILAANAKILLLTADYAKKNNPHDRIYSEGYGIGIFTAERLKSFFEHYLDISEPWFYSLDVDADTKLYGLTDAMTNNQANPSVRNICIKLKNYLKAGDTKYKNPFLIYSLLSVYQIFKEAKDIYYWGYYPSSTTAVNDELFHLKEILRRSFNSSRTKENMLIRVKNTRQRKTMLEHERLSDGCDSQFDSLIVNPWFKGKLNGKTVCIIDDFTNHGSSCETTRHLLKRAGADKIIFITLGKYRYDYKVFDYTLTGDVFTAGGYTYKRNGTYKPKTGSINNKSSIELLNSLKDLLS